MKKLTFPNTARNESNHFSENEFTELGRSFRMSITTHSFRMSITTKRFYHLYDVTYEYLKT